MDHALANEFAATVLPVLMKRHREGIAIEVEQWATSPNNGELARLLARIRHDTSIARARLRERNFAPNRVPLVVAGDLSF